MGFESVYLRTLPSRCALQSVGYERPRGRGGEGAVGPEGRGGFELRERFVARERRLGLSRSDRSVLLCGSFDPFFYVWGPFVRCDSSDHSFLDVGIGPLRGAWRVGVWGRGLRRSAYCWESGWDLIRWCLGSVRGRRLFWEAWLGWRCVGLRGSLGGWAGLGADAWRLCWWGFFWGKMDGWVGDFVRAGDWGVWFSVFLGFESRWWDGEMAILWFGSARTRTLAARVLLI